VNILNKQSRSAGAPPAWRLRVGLRTPLLKNKLFMKDHKKPRTEGNNDFNSFLSVLQLRVSFGLPYNLPPFFSVLPLSSPPSHFHFTKIIMYILQPSQLLR
jgi:hypothetical protein